MTFHDIWDQIDKSEWTPYVECEPCYALVPGTCRVSVYEYGSSSEKLQKGESLFQQVSMWLAYDAKLGSFSGQCALRTVERFGGESIACTYDGKTLEFRLMSGWTGFCDDCASALAAADGAGRPEPELRVIQGNPVALLNPTKSCVYEGDCNLEVRYQRWGRIGGSNFAQLGEDCQWDEKAGMWIRVPVPPKEIIYEVRIGDKTYRLQG